MNREEADEEEAKGNHVKEVEGGFRRIVASPHPVAIVEIDAIKALLDADQIVIACGGGGIPVMEQGTISGVPARSLKKIWQQAFWQRKPMRCNDDPYQRGQCYLKLRYRP